MVMPELWVHA